MVMLSVMLGLTACGGNTANTANTSGTTNESNAGNANTGNAQVSEEVKRIKHPLGTTEIKGIPQRIVVLEWSYVEDLLALGVKPVGVADIENYKVWVNVKSGELAEATDVGTRQEPNLETIMSLKPDLIITDDFRVAQSYDKLSEIAPTLVFAPYSEEAAKDQYADMENAFRTLADIVGKTAEAEQVLDDVQKTYDEAKTKLEAAGKAGQEIVLSQAWSNQNAAAMRLFTDNSYAVKIMEKIGLKNGWKSDKLESYGFSDATVESLTKVKQANFLYVVQDDDNVFETKLKDNAVWKGLDFVKENRAYALGGDTWLFGGPLTAQLLAERAVNLLTK
ncbi:hypothetical protein SY83_12500 [Paenibacillus swuensis]|uniref:Fe/B12 periplasmic-binding domain-containing protein n=2 Tax=Paenibacillus swuensis TaxID=1178515 RepID=A0A172TPC1_9BACL|nr:hypothetical protein SY83_12500 [Paenibacillus swuensis]